MPLCAAEPRAVEVDVQKLTPAQRQLVLDAALKTRDMDNLLLLSKIALRMSRWVNTAAGLQGSSAWCIVICWNGLAPSSLAPLQKSSKSSHWQALNAAELCPLALKLGSEQS